MIGHASRFPDSVVLTFHTVDGQAVPLTIAHLVDAVAELEKEGVVPPLEGRWIARTRCAYGIAE